MVSAYCFSYVVQPKQELYFAVFVSDCQEVQLAAVKTKKLGLSQLLRRKKLPPILDQKRRRSH